MTPERFERLMAAFEPFEACPHVAVALSGGGDSMALLVLAERWARARGGRVTAFTVDHGLRDGSGEEARRVAAWARGLGVGHAVLTWSGDKPETGIQDAARQARYRLLDEACRAHGILHLLVAHSRDDQAETLLLRLGRGSGPDGLAAMSAVRELGACRILRPLLDVARGELRTFLGTAGVDWLEDPSNRDARFARPRLRRRLADDAGLDPAALAESARRYGLVRAVLERDTDVLLAHHCRLDAAGFATLRRGGIAAAPQDLAQRALGRVVAAVGGLVYPPRRRRLERLLGDLATSAEVSVTLGRCHVVATADRIGVYREPRNAPLPLAHVPGAQCLWDRRFQVIFDARPAAAGRDLRLQALSPEHWPEIAGTLPPRAAGAVLPPPARWGLPALADEHGIFAVPHLQYVRQYVRNREQPNGAGIRAVHFAPALPVSAAGFSVA